MVAPGAGTGKFRRILGHGLPHMVSLVRYTKHLPLSKDFARGPWNEKKLAGHQPAAIPEKDMAVFRLFL
jgi:hypothetical protein